MTYVSGNGGGAWVLKDEEPAGPEQRHPFDFEERSDEKQQNQMPNTKKPSKSIPETTVTYITGNGGGAWVLKDEETPGPEQRHPFDLEERTAVFGERIVRFSKTIPRNPSNNRLIDQVGGAGTSVGANFCEANDCFSKKDFRFTVKRCIKEAKETKLFLRMIAVSEPSLAEAAHPLYREATESLPPCTANESSCITCWNWCLRVR